MRWRASGVVAVVVVQAACIDFDAARTQCDAPGGRCAADEGTAGGGGGTASGGGGMASGGGGMASGGGGMASGGGLGPDAGWCDGCVVGSDCIPPPLNDNDGTCGARGTTCANCTLFTQSCRHFTCVPQRTWKKKYASYNAKQLYAVWVGDGGEVWAAGEASTLIHGSEGAFDEVGIGGNVVCSLTSTTAAGHPALVAAGTTGISAVVTVLPLPWTGKGTEPGHSHAVVSEPRIFFSAFEVAGQRYVAGGRQTGQVPSVRRQEADGGWPDVTPDAGWGLVVGAWGTPSGEYYAITTNPWLTRVSPAGVEAWPLPALALGLWGGTSRSLWLAGSSGYVARFDNGGFTRHDAGVEFEWSAVWASSDEHVFLAGMNAFSAGAIAEWDGVRWRVIEPPPATQGFSAIHGGATPETPWAVDLAGALWHFEP